MNNSNSGIDIDRLVRLVMTDLKQNGSQFEPDKKIARSDSVSMKSDSTSAVNLPDVPMPSNNIPTKPEDKKTEDNILEISEKLISLQLIETKDDPDRRIWRVPVRVVVTPMARDELKKRGIRLINASNEVSTSIKGANNADLNRPIGSMKNNSTGYNLSENSGAQSENGRRSSCILAVHEIDSNAFLKGLIARLEKRVDLMTTHKTCLIETAALLAEELKQSEKKAILLTHYPSLALLLANRRSSVRALAGVTLDRFKEESKLIGPNLLVLDPRVSGVFQLQQIVDFFLERSPDQPPKFILEALDTAGT